MLCGGAFFFPESIPDPTAEHSLMPTPRSDSGIFSCPGLNPASVPPEVFPEVKYESASREEEVQ